MILYIKRSFLIALLSSGTCFAGDYCQLIYGYGRAFGNGTGTVLLQTDPTPSGRIVYQHYSAPIKWTCSNNQFSASWQTSDFYGQLKATLGTSVNGGLRLEVTSGHLNNQPLPSEFQYLHTQGHNGH